MNDVWQFGLPRSGTNLLYVLMRDNYGLTLRFNDPIWKHAIWPSVEDFPGPVAVSTKNPYAWLCSVYAWILACPEKNGKPYGGFSEFLYSPFRLYMSRRGVKFVVTAANPISYWNSFHEFWLTQKLGRCVFVRYEELIGGRAEALCDQVAELAGVGRISDTFLFEERTVKASRNLGEVFVKNTYYRNNEYMSAFELEDRELVAAFLDENVCKGLAYPIDGYIVKSSVSEQVHNPEGE
jgi:hypothetical protein